VVKIPSLSPRKETAPTRDENRDGRIDERDERLAAERTGRVAPTSPAVAGDTGADPVVTDRDEDRTTYRSKSATGTAGRTDVEKASERAATAQAASRPNGDTGTHPVVVDRTVEPERTGDTGTHPVVVDHTVEPERTDSPAVTPDVEREPDVVVDRGPRPRTSMFATLSLILGVVGVLFVLTGTLAGYGIGVGAVGALLAVGGLAATRRRHVAGTSDSLIGLLLGLGAVVIGILAMTGQFDWPNTDGDAVQRFREWLDAQFVNRF
jgi:hypothetical protein